MQQRLANALINLALEILLVYIDAIAQQRGVSQPKAQRRL